MRGRFNGFGFVLGLLVGVLIGVFTGRIAIWIGLGVVLGIAFSRRRRRSLQENDVEILPPENRVMPVRGRWSSTDVRTR